MKKVKQHLSPFEKYDKVMQKYLSGGIFLALTIAATIFATCTVFDVFDALLNKGILSILLKCIPVIVAIVTACGLWNTWVNAKKGVVKIREQRGRIMCLSTFYCIMAYVLCIGSTLIGLLIIFLLKKAGSLANSFIDFAEIVELANMEGIGDIVDMAVESTIIVLFLIIVAVVIAFVVFIAKYNALKKIMERISSGYVNDHIPNYSSGFYSIASYVYAFIFCVIAFMFSSDALSIIQNVMYAAMSALSGVMFAVSKHKIYDCYIEQQRELV